MRLSVLTNEIENFDEKNENYDSLRAACYVVQTMGNPYIWPAQHLAGLADLLDTAIRLLETMLSPPSADWGFLEMWGNDPKVDSVRNQIRELRTRRSEIA